MLASSLKKHDDADVARCREWLYGYMRKFGRTPEPHPPDSQIVAQFLAIAEWPRLEALLTALFRERRQPGHSYAWFVAVALNRLHGLKFDLLRERKAELAIARRPAAAEQLPIVDPDPVVSEALALQAELRAAAKAKAVGR